MRSWRNVRREKALASAGACGGHCGWEYEVLYFKRGLKLPTPYDRGDLRMIYGLRYCVDEDGGPSYVHLAGPNDRSGSENVRMVWDGTQAGKWHPSAALWNTFIEQVVAVQGSQ